MRNLMKILSVIIMLAVLCSFTVNYSFALSLSDAKEPLDTTKSCSLTLTYSTDNKKSDGLTVELYQVASMDPELDFKLTNDFADYAIDLNTISSQLQWQEVINTVEAYIFADNIAPTHSKKTDANGIVKFDVLTAGIYYACVVDDVQSFAPLLLCVPGLAEDGKWIYAVEAVPKEGEQPEQNADKLTIIKLWNDGNQKSRRPEKISVDIFCDGEFFKRVDLTAEKNWSYTCETDGEHKWTAVERNVPNGYSVSIQNRDNGIVQITNSLKFDPISPPKTGDDFNILLWVGLMAVSGIALITVGILVRKKHEN